MEKLKVLLQLFVVRSAFNGFILMGFIVFIYMVFISMMLVFSV
jgi:hypothetical protein